ncbi:golgin candidate 5-like isoform X2 [Cynara cardunculus var. scolymus]|uniref:golgin candidate 5-like isoform X2 n=1 Tax=Cynara cardunculus var. scolymus TaxID=59895 RepID=UPI000D62FD04|nr:golgin candidate 5-like isoform X2 [Cynara cardunculus var. scolymus]
MAWFSGKVSLGNFPDLAGAVNKFSESVKNIEKNFDSALGFEDKAGGTTSTAEGSWPADLMAFMGQKGEDGTVESMEKLESSSPQHTSFSKEKEGDQADNPANATDEHYQSVREEKAETLKPEEHKDHPAETNIDVLEEANSEKPAKKNIEVLEEANCKKPTESSIALSEDADIADKPLEINVAISEYAENVAEKSAATNIAVSDETTTTAADHSEAEVDSRAELSADHAEQSEFVVRVLSRDSSEVGSSKKSESIQDESTNLSDQVVVTSELNEVHPAPDLPKDEDGLKIQLEEASQEVSAVEVVKPSYDGQDGIVTELNEVQSVIHETTKVAEEGQLHSLQSSDDVSSVVPEVVPKENNANDEIHIPSELTSDNQSDIKEKHLSSESNSSDNADCMVELEKVKREMKMMETALLGAARQSQAKADEIAKLMTENEHLKSIIEDQRRKSNEADIESLREEYHQRVSTLERKVYALTKERDTLRREQNKKSDAAALLKEKDEIITQVMAEGEALSKKQAAQESQIRKLRAQIREFEEEKKGLIAKLQVEENKVESIKKDKAATEKLLQETIEKNQAELATQKEYYTNALSAAKEAEALAEAQANSEARTELQSHLREAEEREVMLVQTLEELRRTLSRTEQQAVFREEMLMRDVEDLQKRYQASERRCEELVMQVPDSTRPLLRQIEAMQENTARRAEAWTAVERSLNSRLQEAEAKSAAAEERENSVNERLSQTLSRINVLEVQISCLRAEQTQLTRSLEKERQKAAENRQEYLALKEEADTHEDHVKRLEEEMRELNRKHKQELHEALTHQELLQQDIEREKAARLELETTTRLQSSIVPEQSPITRTKSSYENGLTRRVSGTSSLGSMEESFYLQASLDSSDTFSERRNPGEPTMNSYYLKSMTPNAFEAALRQKEGELASYMSRLASMESIRDSLAEELVKMTEECEKLRSEVSLLPGLKADLEALRRRHSAALELMGERDEELEELRADIVDLKEMYREQVNMLVNKIQVLSSSSISASA